MVCITQQLVVKTLLNRLGPSYSKGLGIDLSSGDDGEIFKWFLASLLYGARISESVASRTFKQLVEDGLSTPWSIAQASWAKIVYSLDRGGYVRYDFKTASKLQQASTSLIEKYGGSLNYLHWVAEDERDLEARIRGLAKGIGAKTAHIFLRELRGVWAKASPPLDEWALQAAKNLGFVAAEASGGEALEHLAKLLATEGSGLESLRDLEAALVRLGKNFCRKSRCLRCPVEGFCRLSSSKR